MSGPASSPAMPAPDGSRLCVSCGLCCQGVFHHGVKLQPDEVENAERLGLQIDRGPEGFTFLLPCPHHVEDRCAVYDRRPSSCRRFQCKLLRRYLGGEVGLEEGLSVVRRARELVNGLRSRLGIAAGGPPLWSEMRAQSDVTGEQPEALLDAAALLALSWRHFLDGGEPRRIV